MIFIVIGIFIIFYSFINYKKGFSLYLCYKLILVTNITVISSPGLPLLTLEMAMTLIYIILFIFNGAKYQRAHMKFQFTLPIWLYVASLFISSLLSVAGFGTEISNLIKQLSENVVLIWIAWQIIEFKEDFYYIFKIITAIILFSCVYGFVEYFLQKNPLTEFEATLNNDPNRTIDYSYDSDFRGYRVNSIFEHAIGAGIIWGLYASVVFIAVKEKQLKGDKAIVPLVTAFLCIICVFLTKMRSTYLFLFICILSLINLKSPKFYLLLFIILIVGAICVSFISPDIINVLTSFFNSDSANAVSGSSLEMRLDQFKAAFQLMSISPIFGLGPSFTDVMEGTLIDRLLGSESIWLGVITQLGVIGIIAYIIQVFYFIYKVPKNFKNKYLFIVSLAYWITATVTSMPGFKIIYLYLFLFYIIKNTEYYKLQITRGRIYTFNFNSGAFKVRKIKI